MAYAYSGVNDETAAALKALGVNYARTTVSTHSFELPSDWLRLNPTCHHTEPCFEELAQKFLSGKPSDEFKTGSPGCSSYGGTPTSSTTITIGT